MDLKALILNAVLPHLGELATLVITGVFGLIGKWVLTKEKNEKLFAAMEFAKELMHNIVAELDKTLKPQLEAALADGVLTAEEKAKLQAEALAMMKARLPSDMQKLLEKFVQSGELEKFFLGMLERAVSARRAEEAAAANVEASKSVTDALKAVELFNERLGHVKKAVDGAVAADVGGRT